MPTEEEIKKTEAAQPQAEAGAAAEPSAAEQDEAAKLWAEFADDGAEKKPETPAGEKNPDDFTESQEEADKSADAREPEAAGADAKSEQPGASPPANDIWASASPELRAAHEAEVSALRKSANDAKAQAGRMRKQYQDLKASADKAADSNGPKIGDTLDRSLADYPEIAQPVKDALAPIEKRLESLDKLTAEHRSAKTDEVNRHIVSQQRELEAAYPDWEREYIKGPKGKQFYDWIKSPDRPVKFVETVFETNAEHIFDAKAAIEVFDAFNRDMAATENPPGNGQTQELSAKRAAQLEGSRSPRTPGGPPRVTGIPKEGDPQAIWSAFPDDNADERLSRRRM